MDEITEKQAFANKCSGGGGVRLTASRNQRVFHHLGGRT